MMYNEETVKSPEELERARVACRQLLDIAPLRILLAEDNELNQRFAMKLLAMRGHAVKAVGNGSLALEALAAEPFDLVLMDVSMPGMDGVETTRAIRDHDGSAYDPKIPIIAVTAHALKGDRERFLAAGMDAYLSKPLAPDLFDRTLDAVMGRETASGPALAAAKDACEPFDAALQEKRFSGMREFLPELLDLFRKNAPPCLERIRAAVRESDAQEMFRGAHTLKGMSSVVCAQCVERTAFRIEEAARDGAGDGGAGADDPRRLVAILEKDLADALACLNREASQ